LGWPSPFFCLPKAWCITISFEAAGSTSTASSGHSSAESVFAATSHEAKSRHLPAREGKVSKAPAISNGRAKLTGTSLEDGSLCGQEISAMAKKFKNPEVTKLENKTVLDTTAQKHIERVAEKAAEKATHVEQSFDQEPNDLFKVK
jgi:hypothetical protein